MSVIDTLSDLLDRDLYAQLHSQMEWNCYRKLHLILKCKLVDQLAYFLVFHGSSFKFLSKLITQLSFKFPITRHVF